MLEDFFLIHKLHTTQSQRFKYIFEFVFDLFEYIYNKHGIVISYYSEWHFCRHIAHLQQQCHNSKCVIFLERLLKVLKCYNFLWVQRRHNCSPVASFANCVMSLYLLKVNLQAFLSIPITQKYQILSCDTLVANERCVYFRLTCCWFYCYAVCACLLYLAAVNQWHLATYALYGIYFMCIYTEQIQFIFKSKVTLGDLNVIRKGKHGDTAVHAWNSN